MESLGEGAWGRVYLGTGKKHRRTTYTEIIRGSGDPQAHDVEILGRIWSPVVCVCTQSPFFLSTYFRTWVHYGEKKVTDWGRKGGREPGRPIPSREVSSVRVGVSSRSPKGNTFVKKTRVFRFLY